ncbi:MAG: helix-hairpin-helix domain-containing protein [Desulfosarcina sp.]|nr:helix-hairpin-helix domain-containing protein [Desulfosarcina sp.]
MDINTADREMILRVAGIGPKTANRIVGLRKKGRLRFEHLRQLGAVVSRAQPFIRCDGMEAAQWSGSAPLRRTPFHRTIGSPECLPGAATHSRRTVFETDGSFGGLLTAIFPAYATSLMPDAIVSVGNGQRGLFDNFERIDTDPVIADRVWTGLKRHIGDRQRKRLFQAHLSGHADVDAYPHTRDELEVGSVTDPPSLDDCRRLYPRVRRASTTQSREIVMDWLGSRCDNG